MKKYLFTASICASLILSQNSWAGETGKDKQEVGWIFGENWRENATFSVSKKSDANSPICKALLSYVQKYPDGVVMESPSTNDIKWLEWETVGRESLRSSPLFSKYVKEVILDETPLGEKNLNQEINQVFRTKLPLNSMSLDIYRTIFQDSRWGMFCKFPMTENNLKWLNLKKRYGKDSREGDGQSTEPCRYFQFQGKTYEVKIDDLWKLISASQIYLDKASSEDRKTGSIQYRGNCAIKVNIKGEK